MVIIMYKCSLERMTDKIKTFSKFGDAGHGGITRYSLSEAALMARAEFKKRMEAIGAIIEVDDVVLGILVDKESYNVGADEACTTSDNDIFHDFIIIFVIQH